MTDVVLVIALVVFVVVFLWCNSVVTRWRFPDGPPDPGPVTLRLLPSTIGLLICGSNFFIGWFNYRRWHIGRVMALWLVSILGLIAGSCHLLVDGFQYGFVPWILLLISVPTVWMLTGSALAELSVEALREDPTQETFDGVIQFGHVAVPPLIRVLENDTLDLRVIAADALGAIGPHATAARPALQSTRSSSDGVLAEAAADALRRISAEQFDTIPDGPK